MPWSLLPSPFPNPWDAMEVMWILGRSVGRGGAPRKIRPNELYSNLNGSISRQFNQHKIDIYSGVSYKVQPAQHPQ